MRSIKKERLRKLTKWIDHKERLRRPKMYVAGAIERVKASGASCALKQGAFPGYDADNRICHDRSGTGK